MTTVKKNESTAKKPLRLLPGVVLVIVQWLLWLVVPVVVPDAAFVGVMAGVVGGSLIALWWLFFSRAPWSERVGAILLMIAAMYVTKRIVHESIAGAGMGMLLFIAAIPGLSLALVVWAVATRHFRDGARRATLVAAILLACAPWVLLRTAGLTGTGSEYHWRWTETPEERLLAQASDEPNAIPPAPEPAEAPVEPAPVEPVALPPDPLVETPDDQLVAQAVEEPAAVETGADWPGFRGPHRDGVVRGVEIETDWSKSPPVELWRRPIGPGWSSFAVHGDRLYTPEQRGDDEIVACYDARTGDAVWMHRDAARFWESNGGPGPRGTPTLSNGRVYAFGATGIVNVLDAVDGSAVWSRNAASDTETEVPYWGFASSPLVVGDLVIVATEGQLVGYDIATGNPRWFGPEGGAGYSSPHLLTIDGVEQVLLLSGVGATSVAPTDGEVLWQHEWPGGAIVQPALTADGDVLINAIGMTGGAGTRRLDIAQGPDGWSVKERWTSSGLKPYFNDFVVHAGHAFGFDGSILASIDLEDGKRKWKGGRYGQGQLVLLPDQDVLLVVSEEGELALVRASPDPFTEIARVPALEGKTWNHPVLVRDLLLVRNGEVMVAFRMSLAGG